MEHAEPSCGQSFTAASQLRDITCAASFLLSVCVRNVSHKYWVALARMFPQFVGSGHNLFQSLGPENTTIVLEIGCRCIGCFLSRAWGRLLSFGERCCKLLFPDASYVHEIAP